MSISKKHFALREQAIKLRLKGQSYRQFSKALNVARSTLNGWLKNVAITQLQQQKLHQQWLGGLSRARSKAGERSIQAKLNRIRVGQITANKVFKSLSLDNSELELFMAGLYLGEGVKIENRLGLGNANPEVVLLF